MEPKSDLSKVKVGDWVLTLESGWVKFEEFNKAGGEFYHNNGIRIGSDAKYPTCFPADQVPVRFLEIYGPPPARNDLKKEEGR